MLLTWTKTSASTFLPSCIGYCLEESPYSLRLRRPHTPLCHSDVWSGSHFGVDTLGGPLIGEKQTFFNSCCLQYSETRGLQIGGKHSSWHKILGAQFLAQRRKSIGDSCIHIWKTYCWGRWDVNIMEKHHGKSTYLCISSDAHLHVQHWSSSVNSISLQPLHQGRLFTPLVWP